MCTSCVVLTCVTVCMCFVCECVWYMHALMCIICVICSVWLVLDMYCKFYACHVFYTWRRQWHPTPVLLSGKSHGQRSLVGYSPWGRKESDVTE